MQKRKWSDREVVFLIQNKGKLSHEKIADKLQKTILAVNRKVARLGITKKHTGTRLKNGIKKCSRCRLNKTEAEFANNTTRLDGKEVWCKRCRIENMHGMDIGEYKKRYADQNGCCAICHNKYSQLVVDHCHNSGKLRGLLCNPCNFLLGNAFDNPKILTSASRYLKLHNITKTSATLNTQDEQSQRTKSCNQSGSAQRID